MKNLKSVLFLVCLFTSGALSAQFSIGLQGGFTKAWEEYGDVGLPDDAEIDISGLNISILAYHRLGKNLQIGVEPGFARRGAACEPGWNVGPGPIFRGDTKLLLNYVEAPLMVSGNLNFFQNKFEVFGKVGYGTSFLASAYSEEITLGTDEPAERTRINLDESSSRLNRWDHGIYTGFGVAYNLGKNQIFLASDVYMGMKDADRNNTSKNRSVDFNIGYMIRL